MALRPRLRNRSRPKPANPNIQRLPNLARPTYWAGPTFGYTGGGLDVRFEIFVDINLLIKRFLKGFRLSFGGIKGFFLQEENTGILVSAYVVVGETSKERFLERL